MFSCDKIPQIGCINMIKAALPTAPAIVAMAGSVPRAPNSSTYHKHTDHGSNGKLYDGTVKHGFCPRSFESRRSSAESNLDMSSLKVGITYVGGPTCLIEFGGVRLLTDPTFDSGGGEYVNGPVTLHKLRGPALDPESLAPLDCMLLSHDHHFDNLDHAGRATLAKAKTVFTTEEGATRLGGNSVGLNDWQIANFAAPNGRFLRIVATPAQHGPAGMNRGAVIGFVFFFTDRPDEAIYVSGDTVWFDGIAEVARRFDIQLAILHLGAARVPAVGPFHLTMTANEALHATRTFANAPIVPIHFEDWAHFSEGREDISSAFGRAGLEHRLRWPERGGTIQVEFPAPIAKAG